MASQDLPRTIEHGHHDFSDRKVYRTNPHGGGTFGDPIRQRSKGESRYVGGSFLRCVNSGIGRSVHYNQPRNLKMLSLTLRRGLGRATRGTGAPSALFPAENTVTLAAVICGSVRGRRLMMASFTQLLIPLIAVPQPPAWSGIIAHTTMPMRPPSTQRPARRSGPPPRPKSTGSRHRKR